MNDRPGTALRLKDVLFDHEEIYTIPRLTLRTWRAMQKAGENQFFKGMDRMLLSRVKMKKRVWANFLLTAISTGKDAIPA